MRGLVIFVAGVLTGCLLGYLCQGWRPAAAAIVTERVVTDTLRDTAVAVAERRVVRYVTLPATSPGATATDPDPCDSVTTEPDTPGYVIPIEQVVYRDSDYTAWVSGYQPSLDSIEVYRHSITRTITAEAPAAKRPRLGVGVQLGVGIDPQARVTPYLGVGISYNIITF